MTISAHAASPAASTPRAASPLPRCTAERFVLATPEGGYLMACTGIGGVPVRLVPNPLDAVRFSDIDTAALRARHLSKLGWAGISVVPIRVPLP